MFLGSFEHTMDAKGRLAIPARFRNSLGSTAVLTRSPDHCLYLFPMDAWNKLAERLSQLSLADRNARNMQHFFFGGASDVELDAQGRIAVPTMLRQHAEVEGDTVVVGMNTYIEIWARQKWQNLEAQVSEDIDNISAQLVGLF